jgi:hypothetical protein
MINTLARYATEFITAVMSLIVLFEVDVLNILQLHLENDIPLTSIGSVYLLQNFFMGSAHSQLVKKSFHFVFVEQTC